MKIFCGSEQRGDEITLKWKENENTLWTAQRACRRHTGSPNWQLGTFREVILSVSSCGWIEKQFSMLMPLTKSQTKLEKNYFIHPDATSTTTLSSLQTGFCFFFRHYFACLAFLMLALCYFCSKTISSWLRPGEKERTFQESTDLRWISAIVLLSMEKKLSKSTV